MLTIEIKKDLKKLSNPDKIPDFQRFFKTKKGEYGEGDIFIGVKMPDVRKVVRKYCKELDLQQVQELLNSKIHEERMTALLVLVEKYLFYNKLASKHKQELGINKCELREEIVDLYLKNYQAINNWDLVDLSAPKILGDWFIDKDKSVLYEWAKSNNLWKKRIAMMACFGFIRQNEYEDALNIAEILLFDEHDLIHKAVGWMLREIGNRDLATEEKFLKRYYKKMPRTALRYAIEKFPEPKRKKYLNGKI